MRWTDCCFRKSDWTDATELGGLRVGRFKSSICCWWASRAHEASNNWEQAAELGEELGLESPVGHSDPLSVPLPWLRVCALRTRPINRRLHPLTSCGFTTEGAGETGQSEEGVLNPCSPSYGVEAGASPGWPFLSGNSPRPAVVSWPPDTGLTDPCGSLQPNHKCTQYSCQETALHWYFRVCGFLPGPWLIQGRWES